ncbi:MAG TPA: enoyl-CoA hydratase-related protein [Cellvibrionaceae bacterium]|nr:enoyl-CoA hydratase-related protein [Cellvibrionaceae bacterium]HMY38325.1 enoyl-CoA hydratase-related protein [Marinagarivorans sp.]HNG61300.1 enoyl-CoA hydratase-related protein [Cellvibrionaceae bacterium]
MTDIYVRSAIEAGVFYISWGNPASKNALSIAMYEQIEAALKQAEAQEDIKVCVLLGGEGDFCSGNDLAEFIAGRKQGGAFFKPLLNCIHRLASFKKPLLAAVNGWAVGIGATMLLHCDAVIAAPSAQFSLPFNRLGLCCECGASLLLPLRIGQGRAADWLLRAEPIVAADALQAGFINRVCDDPAAVISDYAREISGRPLSALLAHRALLQEPWQEALAKAMAAEEARFFQLLQGPEFAAIVAAMSAKWRSPNPTASQPAP